MRARLCATPCHQTFTRVGLKGGRSHEARTMLTTVQGPRHYRAIFISDIHLGTRRAKTTALLDF